MLATNGTQERTPDGEPPAVLLLIIRISTYTAPITFDRNEEGYEW